MVKKLQVSSVVFLLIVGGLLLWYTPALLPAASTMPPGRPSDRKPEFYFSTPESIEFCKLLDSSDTNATIRLQQLIKDGLDVNVRGKYGMTLLAWAFYRDNRHVFHQLLKAGADPDLAFTETFELHLLGEIYAGETVPGLAVRNWLYGYTLDCLPHMRDVNRRENHGYTLLLSLARTKSDDARLLFEQLLMRSDVELNVVNKLGSTALDLAFSEANYEHVVSLLRAGADVSAGYRGGHGLQTNLHVRYDFARESKDTEVIEKLAEIMALLKE